jgi:hypothetical protein
MFDWNKEERAKWLFTQPSFHIREIHHSSYSESSFKYHNIANCVWMLSVFLVRGVRAPSRHLTYAHDVTVRLTLSLGKLFALRKFSIFCFTCFAPRMPPGNKNGKWSLQGNWKWRETKIIRNFFKGFAPVLYASSQSPQRQILHTHIKIISCVNNLHNHLFKSIWMWEREITFIYTNVE